MEKGKKKDVKAKSPTVGPRVVRKSVSMVRRDVETWRNAVRQALLDKDPKTRELQDLYDDVMLDNVLESQVNNRFEQTVPAGFELVDESGRVDEGLTGMLTGMGIVPDLIGYMLESNLYGYSLVELSAEGGSYGVELISRRNVSPLTGRLYPDANGDAYIAYREIAEYGRWVLEFNSGHLGKLNRLAIPALFKKFAKSCWSELCEIYGIPPRYMKTNTTDPAMLDRAEAMMRELGAAAWFVIDTTEEFEFAQGSSTNGDVYRNLIRDCNNEMSMSVSGAIIGQDTENGNYSREESNRKLLKGLIASDRRMVERRMNDTVLPALTSIGWMPVHGLRFRFAAVEDTEFLWTVTKELLPHKEVDSEWITEKFGIPVRDRTVGDFP